jgi:hypothetical protein
MGIGIRGQQKTMRGISEVFTFSSQRLIYRIFEVDGKKLFPDIASNIAWPWSAFSDDLQRMASRRSLLHPPTCGTLPVEERKLAAQSAVSSPNVKLLESMIEHIVIKTLTKLQKNLPVIIKIYVKKPVRPEKAGI